MTWAEVRAAFEKHGAPVGEAIEAELRSAVRTALSARQRNLGPQDLEVEELLGRLEEHYSEDDSRRFKTLLFSVENAPVGDDPALADVRKLGYFRQSLRRAARKLQRPRSPLSEIVADNLRAIKRGRVLEQPPLVTRRLGTELWFMHEEHASEDPGAPSPAGVREAVLHAYRIARDARQERGRVFVREGSFVVYGPTHRKAFVVAVALALPRGFGESTLRVVLEEALAGIDVDPDGWLTTPESSTDPDPQESDMGDALAVKLWDALDPPQLELVRLLFTKQRVTTRDAGAAIGRSHVTGGSELRKVKELLEDVLADQDEDVQRAALRAIRSRLEAAGPSEEDE